MKRARNAAVRARAIHGTASGAILPTFGEGSGMEVGRYVTSRVRIGCPDEIEICHDGAAIAFFGDEPSLRYDDLDALLARYRLDAQDLRPSSLRVPHRSSRPPRA